MKGGHHLTVTVKRHLAASGILVADHLRRASQLISLVDKGCLGGISDLLAVFVGGVIAENTVAEKLLLCRIIQVNIFRGNLTAFYIVEMCIRDRSPSM